jgi:hypothetical protein
VTYIDFFSPVPRMGVVKAANNRRVVTASPSATIELAMRPQYLFTQLSIASISQGMTIHPVNRFQGILDLNRP